MQSGNGLTRIITIIAMTCFLVVGAAATSILGRDSVPAARPETALTVGQNPVSNRESKKDRLAVATPVLASFGPPQTASLSEPLRQAFASTAPADIEMPKFAAPAALAAAPKSKLVAKPAPQKYSGEVELRGLDAGKTYKVTDYVHQKDYGTVTGPTGKLNVEFTGNILLEAAPAQ